MLTSVSLVMTVLTVGGWTGRIVYTIHYIMLYKVLWYILYIISCYKRYYGMHYTIYCALYHAIQGLELVRTCMCTSRVSGGQRLTGRGQCRTGMRR